MILFMSVLLALVTYEISLLSYIALAAHSQLLLMKMRYQWPRACVGTPTILKICSTSKNCVSGAAKNFENYGIFS